jgi:hypothetical protein
MGGAGGTDGGKRQSDFKKNRRGASPDTKRELWLNAQKVLRKKGELPFPPKAWHMKRWPHHPKTCYDGECFYRRMTTKATMMDQNLMFCNGCPNPRESGSQAWLWNAHYSLWRYEVDAELVMAVPNDASGPLLNEYQVHDAVAVVLRGTVSIIDKIRTVQKAGAVAVLIIDDGSCGNDFRCRLGEKAPNVGFASGDRWENWLDVYIPAFLVTQRDGQRILNALPVQKHLIPGYGEQLVHIDEHNEL